MLYFKLYLKLIYIFFRNNLTGYTLQFFALVFALLLIFLVLSLPKVIEVQAGPGKNWAADLNLLATPTAWAEIQPWVNNYLLANPPKLNLSARQIHLPKQSFKVGKQQGLEQSFNFKEVPAAKVYLPLEQGKTKHSCLLTGLEATSLSWNFEITHCQPESQATSFFMQQKVNLEALGSNYYSFSLNEEQLSHRQRIKFYNFLQQGLAASLPLEVSGLGLDLSAASQNSINLNANALNIRPLSLEQIQQQKALAALYQLVLPNKYQPVALLNSTSAINLNGRFSNYLNLGWLTQSGKASSLGNWVFRPLVNINPPAQAKQDFTNKDSLVSAWSGISWVGEQGFNQLVEALANQQIAGSLYYYQQISWQQPKLAEALYEQLQGYPGVQVWLAKQLQPQAELDLVRYVNFAQAFILLLLALILFAGLTNFYNQDKTNLAFLRYQGLSLPVYGPVLLTVYVLACFSALGLVLLLNSLFKQDLAVYSFPAYNLPYSALLVGCAYVFVLVLAFLIYEVFGFKPLANSLLEEIDNEH